MEKEILLYLSHKFPQGTFIYDKETKILKGSFFKSNKEYAGQIRVDLQDSTKTLEAGKYLLKAMNEKVRELFFNE